MKFQTQKEVYQALVDGKILINIPNNESVYIDTISEKCVAYNSKGQIVDRGYVFDNPKEWRVHEETINISVKEFYKIYEELFGIAAQSSLCIHQLIKKLERHGAIK